MLTTDIEKELFKVFTTKQCPDVDMYNSLCVIVKCIVRDELGKADAEIYDLIVDLQNSENNAGWENRHTRRIDMLYDLAAIIKERSGDYLP